MIPSDQLFQRATTLESQPANLPAPTAPPVAPPRVIAFLEVVLCSGLPTQLALTLLLAAVGVRALDAGGQLSLAYVVALSLTDAVLLLGLIFSFLWLHGESPRYVFLGHRPPRQEIALGVVLTPVMVVAAVAGLAAVHVLAPSLRNVPNNPLEALIRSPLDALLFVVVAVIAGGLREELQRAFVLRRFEQHLGGGWVGLVVFSVAFGLGHQIQGWDAAIVTGTLGAVWGALYLMRRSVFASMVSHAGFNVAEILIAVSATATV